MIQHMILRGPNGRTRLTSADGRFLVACGRTVGSGHATSAAMTTCRACKGTAAWDKAINGVEGQ